MARLALFVLLSFGCSRFAAPELHVAWSAGRATRDTTTTRHTWEHAGTARLSWPLAPRRELPTLVAPTRGAASPLPGALGCLDASLCAWERDARRRALRRHREETSR